MRYVNPFNFVAYKYTLSVIQDYRNKSKDKIGAATPADILVNI